MIRILLINVLLLYSLHLTTAWKHRKRLPNIIFILADDTGWNDVGFHGSNQIPTPNIDALAYSGTILHNYYTQPICTPSRSALMTGRHPINNGMQHDVIFRTEPWGLPLTETLLPQYLKKFGYVNRAVGKWHLGFFKEVYTPTFRGFDSHFGYWLGHQHYFTHKTSNGYDFRRDMEVSWNSSGKYATDLFTDEAVNLIKDHDKRSPLFLYVAHIATHAPLEAPAKLIKKFKYIKNCKRRTFAAVLTKMDESVGRIVAALKAKGMLDNSIIVFTSDNGGATNGYNGNVASNFPLRGCKDTLWEGGVRVPAVIWSPLLTTAPRIHTGLMSVMDWLPTLISAVTNSSYPSEKHKLDGSDQWCALKGECSPPYTTLLHNIDQKGNNAALRKGKWKVITGNTNQGKYDYWYGQVHTRKKYNLCAIQKSLVAKSLKETSKPLPSKKTISKTRKKVTIKCFKTGKSFKDCFPKVSACLFNIDKDPCEQNNLAEVHPKILRKLEDILKNNYDPVKPNNKRGDPSSNPKFWNYTWCNWKDYPSPFAIYGVKNFK